MPSRMDHVAGLVSAAGIIRSFEILLRRALGISGRVAVRVPGGVVEVRPGNSDLFVLSQVFGRGEYAIDPARLAALRAAAAAWRQAGDTPVIVDAGANVGYAARYFAALFPDTPVLAVEPDPESFAILARHAAGVPAIVPVHGALWSHGEGLALQATGSGSWSHRMAEGAGTPSFRLDTLLARVPNPRPLILKLDIEGAEREVVESCPEIFAAARCILVEPHDFMKPGGACLAPLYRVAARRAFDTVLNGENLQLFAVD